jgi:hypothetical protein
MRPRGRRQVYAVCASLTALLALCLFLIGLLLPARAEARPHKQDALPFTCKHVRALVRALGSVAAAEAYAAQRGIRLTATQRRQAIRCLRARGDIAGISHRLLTRE